jgi:hypothetical protein
VQLFRFQRLVQFGLPALWVMVFPVPGCFCSLCNDTINDYLIPAPWVFINYFLGDSPVALRVRAALLRWLQHDNHFHDQNYWPYLALPAAVEVEGEPGRESMWVDQ